MFFFAGLMLFASEPPQVSPGPQHPPVLRIDSLIAEKNPFFFFFSVSIFATSLKA
jgi:hypothetical protein